MAAPGMVFMAMLVLLQLCTQSTAETGVCLAPTCNELPTSCPASDRCYPDPQSCSSYYRCDATSLVRRQCPDDTYVCLTSTSNDGQGYDCSSICSGVSSTHCEAYNQACRHSQNSIETNGDGGDGGETNRGYNKKQDDNNDDGGNDENYNGDDGDNNEDDNDDDGGNNEDDNDDDGYNNGDDINDQDDDSSDSSDSSSQDRGDSEDDDKMIGLIVGITLGIMLLVGIGTWLAYCCWRKQKTHVAPSAIIVPQQKQVMVWDQEKGVPHTLAPVLGEKPAKESEVNCINEDKEMIQSLHVGALPNLPPLHEPPHSGIYVGDVSPPAYHSHTVLPPIYSETEN